MADINSHSAPAPKVSIRGLTKRFQTVQGQHVALDNIWLDLAPAEFLVLLGPSGCGKTTLLRSVAGLEMPDEGEIYVNGQLVFSADKGIWLPPEKRQLSMVFQSYALWPHMSIFENIAFPLRNIGTPTHEIKARVQRVLETIGLPHLSQSYPGQLSGGQQQRIALARAIVWKSDLILFDEPLSNLDAKVRERLRIELKNIQSDLQFSSLYVTHDQSEAMALADRIVVMRDGQIVQSGQPLDIYAQPHSHYVADFIGSTNEIEGRIIALEDTLLIIDTPLGHLRAARLSQHDLTLHQNVIVMFRPHHCHRGQTNPNWNRITGILNHNQFLGIQTDRILDINGHSITLTEFSDEPLSAGTQIDFALSPNHIRIFATHAAQQI